MDIPANFKNILDKIMEEKPQEADAIVWLQGDRYDRARKVLGLFKKGWAKKILLSGNNIPPTMKRIEGVDYEITLINLADWLKKRGVNSKDILIDDKSFNTAMQANNVLLIAKKKNWKKIILTATSFHQVRVFLTFLGANKRIGWKGRIINQPTRINWEKVPGGRNKKAKYLVFEEIDKIREYKRDVAGYQEGLNYLLNKK